MTPETQISVVRYGCTIYMYVWLSTTCDYGCNTESYGPIRIATNVHPWLIRRPVRECVTWALHYKTRIKTWSNLSLSHNSYDTNLTAQPYIRVTRGIMICVAKAKLPSNLAAQLHDKWAEADLFSYDKVQILLICAQNYNASLKLRKT